MIFIGIDTGTHTGVAVWNSEDKEFIEIKTLMLHQALQLVITMCQVWKRENVMVLLRMRGRENGLAEMQMQRGWEQVM